MRAPSRPQPVTGSCSETAATEQERGERAGDAEAWRRWDSDKAICRRGADLDSCSQPPPPAFLPPSSGEVQMLLPKLPSPPEDSGPVMS